jgi:AcrR family transcriptional regulator
MSKKQEILDAAIRLFANKDFRDASMTDLSETTGVVPSTIFYHFKTKEDLFLAVLGNIKTSIIEKFQSYVEGNEFKTGLEMVEGVVSFYVYLSATSENWFLILHRHYPYKLAGKNPVCRQHLEEIFNCYVDIFEKAVLRGQDDGSIVETDARKKAIILFSMVDSFVRFKTHNLIDSGALFNELVTSCNWMLKP